MPVVTGTSDSDTICGTSGADIINSPSGVKVTSQVRRIGLGVWMRVCRAPT